MKRNGKYIDVYIPEEEIETNVTEETEEEVNDIPVVEEADIVNDTTVTVNTPVLNVRKDKDTSSDILRTVSKGEKLVGTMEEEWFKLNDGGFVMSKFVV